MVNLDKLWSLDPVGRRRVLKILLTKAEELKMAEEAELLAHWLEEDPNEPLPETPKATLGVASTSR